MEPLLEGMARLSQIGGKLLMRFGATCCSLEHGPWPGDPGYGNLIACDHCDIQWSLTSAEQLHGCVTEAREQSSIYTERSECVYSAHAWHAALCKHGT